jgi:hypothetical protein
VVHKKETGTILGLHQLPSKIQVPPSGRPVSQTRSFSFMLIALSPGRTW